jgi:hypothetical protein
MAEHFLNRANVVVGLKQMRGEAVAEGVGRDALREPGPSNSFMKRFLNMGFMDMITSPILCFIHVGQ